MTENEQKIYMLIFNFIREYHYSPSCRELADISFYSVKYIHNVLSSLRQKGYISYQDKKPRTIVLNKITK